MRLTLLVNGIQDDQGRDVYLAGYEGGKPRFVVPPEPELSEDEKAHLVCMINEERDKLAAAFMNSTYPTPPTPHSGKTIDGECVELGEFLGAPS